MTSKARKRAISTKRLDNDKVSDLVAADADKAEMLIAFFASVFASDFSQLTALREGVQREVQPAVDQGIV